MLTTTNFKLKKPESTDYAKISDINDNMDIIDAEIAKRPTRDDMDDVIDTKFTVSTSRAKLTPGEKLKVLFGKIERWIEDLKDGAFSAVANNLTTTGAGSVLDARQGKALKDQVDTKANKADVVNNLTTTDYGYILDARQGKALSDKIDSAKSSLSASVATKLASANVVNNVTTKERTPAMLSTPGRARYLVTRSTPQSHPCSRLSRLVLMASMVPSLPRGQHQPASPRAMCKTQSRRLLTQSMQQVILLVSHP